MGGNPIALVARPGVAAKARVYSPNVYRLFRQLACLALLFILELVAVSIWIDTNVLSDSHGLAYFVGEWGPIILRSVVAGATVFVAVSYLKSRTALEHFSAQLEAAGLNWSYLAIHVCSTALFLVLSKILIGNNVSANPSNALTVAWLASGILLAVTGAFTFLAPRLWLVLVRITRTAWIYALASGTLIYPASILWRWLWKPAAGLTFTVVRFILRPLIPNLITNPATFTIGTSKFDVTISGACSGMEGAGLMLIFTLGWIWLFRKECRLPHCFVIVPGAVSILWIINALRIATLILIGVAGAPAVATGGFHSQAGWIAFNGVALGLVLLMPRVRWFSVSVASKPERERPADNATAAYLLPFLAMVAATMISRAASSGFEWLYPLRFAAVAMCLLWFRRRYRSLNWRFGWLAPAAGAMVFLMWIGLDRIIGSHAANSIESGMQGWSSLLRIAWLAIRTCSAVITVPIAEELAFRAYLTRRLVSADFESVPLQAPSAWHILVASLAFGIMHGDRCAAGVIAGIVYALLLRWKGRIGDAVIAHAVTNGLLAVWVLALGKWEFW